MMSGRPAACGSSSQFLLTFCSGAYTPSLDTDLEGFSYLICSALSRVECGFEVGIHYSLLLLYLFDYVLAIFIEHLFEKVYFDCPGFSFFALCSAL